VERFPCLGLAYQALEAGGAATAVLNAANEVAVQAFLDGRLGFVGIPRVISVALDRHATEPAGNLAELTDADRAARRTAERVVSRGVGS
jgi:1-deoxy-D-xylulose-5-phosphate reductoisomerase